MVDLPQKKAGIIACSGEELPEGTVTRLAALKVLEELRPADTVTICLPSSWLEARETGLLPAFTRPLPWMAVSCAAQPAPRRCTPENQPPASW